MDIGMIERTIRELETGETSFDACQKLASLYVIRNEVNKFEEDNVEKELNDILPMYQMYVKTKRRYQRHEVSSVAVEESMKAVCKEIEEFIQTLYTGTEMTEEREILFELVEKLSERFANKKAVC